MVYFGEYKTIKYNREKLTMIKKKLFSKLLVVASAILTSTLSTGAPLSAPLSMSNQTFDNDNVGTSNTRDEQNAADALQTIKLISTKISGVASIAIKSGRNTTSGTDGQSLEIAGWVGYDQLNEDDDSGTGFSADIDTTTIGFGADTFINDNLLLGLSYVFSDSDSDTRATAGATKVGIDTELSSFVLYGAYIINDNVYVDGLYGIGFGDLDAGVIDHDVDTSMAALHINYANSSDNIDYVLATGLNRTFVDNDDDIANGVTGQGDRTLVYDVSAEVGFTSGSWRPFVGATYYHYLTDRYRGFDPTGFIGAKNGNNDSDQLDIKLGVETTVLDSINLSASYSHAFMVDDYDGHGLSLNARINF
jgi:hypothetical protein